MANPKGKRAALLSAVIGLLILTSAAWAFRNRLQEEWYILRLKSSRPGGAEQAARSLGDLGTPRAIPDLLEAFKRSIITTQVGRAGFGDHEIQEIKKPDILQSVIRISLRDVPGSKSVLNKALEDGNEMVRSAAALAILFADSELNEEYLFRSDLGKPRIWRGWIGDNNVVHAMRSAHFKTFPALIRALEHPSPYLRRIAAESLGGFHHHGRPAVPALRKLLGDPDPGVRAAAESALKWIDGGVEAPAQ